MTQENRITLKSGFTTNLADSSNITAAELRTELGDIADSAYILSTDTINTILPTQTGNSGKYLTTNGTAASWATTPGSALTTKGDVLVHDGSNAVRAAAGSDGQMLIYDASATNGVAAYAKGFGPMAYRSNRYYGPWVVNNFATVTVSANVIRFAPVYVFKRNAFTAVGYRSTGGGNAAHFGIYNDNGGLPGTLVAGSDVTVGAITTGSTQDATFASPVTLTPGWYWIAVLTNGSETMISSASSSQNVNIVGADSINGSAATSGDAVTAAQAYGALPSTAPSPAFLGAGNSTVYLALKAQ